MRFLSLFSGIEAASAAWLPLGWECVAVSEIDPFACAVLAQRHPDVPNLGDITKITESDIAMLGGIDLVVFGSPCQDLSVAGKRKGLDGARSGLFFNAMQIVQWGRDWGDCRFALWENVPGAFSSNAGADFGVVVGQMAGLEYTELPPKGWGTEGAIVGPQGMVEWSVLDAQWAGVAQRRRRVFALADFGDWANRPPILLEPESLRGDSAPSREAGQGASRGFETGPGASRESHTSACDGHVICSEVSPTLDQRAGRSGANSFATSGGLIGLSVALRGREGGGTAELGGPVSGTLRASGGGGDKQHVLVGLQRPVRVEAFGGNNTAGAIDVATARNACASASGRMDFESETSLVQTVAFGTTQITSTPVAFAQNSRDEVRLMNGDGQIVGALAAEPGMKQTCYVAYTLQHAQIGRKDEAGPQGKGWQADVAFTQDSRTSADAVVYGMQVRRLTPRECERLQAFPEIRKHIRVNLCSDLQKSNADVETACLKSQCSALNADGQGSRPTVNAAGQPLSTCLANQNEHAAVHALIDLELQLLVLHCAGKLLLSVGFAEFPSRYHLLTHLGNIAHRIVPLLESQERETLAGKVGSQPFTPHSSGQKNGSASAQVFGSETNALASDAAMFTTKLSAFTKSTTSPVGQNTPDCERSLQTLCCFATAAISSCIPKQIPPVSFYDLEIVTGHTLITVRGKPAADGPRYKALGNSMCVNVMAWIGKQIDNTVTFY